MGDSSEVRQLVREVFTGLFLPEKAEEEIIKVINFKLYEDSYHTGEANNLLVYGNDDVYLWQFMQAFDRLVGLYDPERSKFRLVFLETFPEEIKGVDPEYIQVRESFEQAHAEIMADPSLFRVIATTSTDDRDLFSGDERFRYQTMNHFIDLDFTGVEDLYLRFMKFLEEACASGRYGFYDMTEAFRDDMWTYFSVIYSDRAINKNLSFLQDMRRRIIQIYGEQEKREAVLDVGNVPCYDKNYGEKDDAKPSGMRLPAFPEDGRTYSPDGLNKNAVILLFLSEARASSPENQYFYTDDNGDEKFYYGIQTSDAPMQFLIDQIVRDGRKLSAVLCITSYDVKNKPIDGQTAYKRFKDLVSSYYKMRTGSSLTKDVFCEIPYDYTPGKDDKDGEKGEEGKDVRTPFRQETAYAVFSLIRSKLNEMEDCGVYIDYSGGLRDVTLLLATIIRFLEFSDNSCERIIYSKNAKWDKGCLVENGSLVDISYIYNIFHLINGTGSFLSTGNARQLLEAFDQTDDQSERDILNAISAFSDVTMLNDLTQLEEKLSEAAKLIEAYEGNKETVNRINQGMLASMIPVIRRKMHLADMVRDSKIDYPVLINWCLENGMIQQALTVYVDKLPIYYFDTERIRLNEDFPIKPPKGSGESKLKTDQGSALIQGGKLMLQNGVGKPCGEVFYEDLFDDIFEAELASDEKTIQELVQLRDDIRNETDMVNLSAKTVVFNYWVKNKLNTLSLEYALCNSNLNIRGGNQGSNGDFNNHILELDRLAIPGCEFSTIYQLYRQDKHSDLSRLGIAQKEFSGFLRQAVNSIPYQIFGFSEDKMKSIKGKENTVLKKMRSIRGLIELDDNKARSWFGSVENKNRLVYTMSYYLAMKMFRNSSNHANEEDEGSATREVESFFSNTELPALPGSDQTHKIVIEHSYKGIYGLLSEGIRFSQADWQVPVCLNL